MKTVRQVEAPRGGGSYACGVHAHGIAAAARPDRSASAQKDNRRHAPNLEMSFPLLILKVSLHVGSRVKRLSILVSVMTHLHYGAAPAPRTHGGVSYLEPIHTHLKLLLAKQQQIPFCFCVIKYSHCKKDKDTPRCISAPSSQPSSIIGG